MSPWVCVALSGAGLSLLLLLWLPRLRAIARAQQPEHHREAALALLGRRSALIHGEGKEAWLTSAGVGVVYSCAPHEGEGVRHHVSVSLGGGPIPLALALPFVAYVARATGIDPARLEVAVTDAGILHATTALPADEHARWGTGPGDVPAEGPPAVAAFTRAREDADGLRARLTRLDLGPLRG